MFDNISVYENSAKEIANCFDTISKAPNWNDAIFHSEEIYSNLIISGENIIDQKGLRLDKTKSLISKNLVQVIFLNSDSSIYYNIYNSESSMSKSYRHILCFSSHHDPMNFEMINHAYRILKKKSISKEWSYIILEIGFD